MTQTFVERLQPLVLTADVDGVQALLASLDTGERAEAAHWLGQSRRWYSQSRRHVDALVLDQSVRLEVWGELPWILALCAVELCGPTTAAERVPWADFWDYPHYRGESLLTSLVCAKDSTWATRFVEAASRTRLTDSEARQGGAVLSRILRAVGRHHHTPCPTGAAFYHSWTAGCPEPSLTDAVAGDPWMPELLDYYLDHGGTDPDVLEAIPTWIEQGVTSRERLLQVSFSLLLTNRRPGSQIMLAKILSQLETTADEVPGGLDYLLGAIATVVGQVGKALLPWAIDLVDDADGMLQLTTVIAARSEKAQKKSLLAALAGPLRQRVGDSTTVAALQLMQADSDTQFAQQVGAAIRAIDAHPEEPDETASPSLGLWALSPTRLSAEQRRAFTHERFEWPEFLTEPGRPKDRTQAIAVDAVLSCLAEGHTYQLRYLQELTLSLLDSGRLVLSRFTGLLPDLFLGGGMKEVWPVALRIADACAARATTPPALAELLRTLAGYAAEAPTSEPGMALADLASRNGRTKAHVEASQLVATMTAHRPPVAEREEAPGTPTPPAPARPERIVMASPDWTDEQLLRTLSRGYYHVTESCNPLCLYPEGHRQLRKPHAWVPELALAALVKAIAEGRGAEMRRGVLAIERITEPPAIIAAIDLWATGRLDHHLFWRIALNSVTTQERGGSPVQSPDTTWGRVADLPGFPTLGSDGPVELPAALDGAAARLAFLRACECLLLAEQNSVVLATPSYYDGTLTLDALLGRLDRVGPAPAGMLDLMQALYRLREEDPARSGEIPGGRWFTAAGLMAPEGGRPADIGELLRSWVAAGGMTEPPTRWDESDRRRAELSGPVPWRFAASAPREFTQDELALGQRLDVLRTFPRFSELATTGWTLWPIELIPTGAHGRFGPILHWRVLSAMSAPERWPDTDVDFVVRTAFQLGRMDPATAVAAFDDPQTSFTDRELAEFARSWGRLLNGEARAAAWPVLLQLGICRAASRYHRPADAEIFAVLAEHARELPRPGCAPADLERLRASVEGCSDVVVRRYLDELIAALEGE
ncbi:hypothetical protein ATK74_1890 [Propionicimonas paludicola]|uniref:Uncharacterized protein n=1 Tax=Propionicimonas paludicola TaxID=185243 RepID=A0A2A9CSB4_9ACTN|nr:hypothetical protein ATK74_1890 [Propionicimonas paludicola]